MEKLLKINDFARLVKVSKTTLQYYKQIGLFNPILIDKENNYSYYSYKQYDEIKSIEILKNIGIPLKDIKNYIDDKSSSNLLEVLDTASLSIESKLNELKYLEKVVNRKKENLNLIKSHPFFEVFISNEEDEWYLASEHELNEEAIQNAINFDLDSGLKMKFYDFFSVVRHGVTSINDLNRDARLVLTSTVKQKNLEKKEEGKYLAILHEGDYNSVDFSYELLLDYAKENNLAIDDTFYEVDLIDSLTTNNKDKFVNKIMVKIKD